jgi:hypothetical protein
VPAGGVPPRMVSKDGRNVSQVDDDSVLAIPEGWLLDRVGRDRLRRQLTLAEPVFTAVVARAGRAVPGVESPGRVGVPGARTGIGSAARARPHG